MFYNILLCPLIHNSDELSHFFHIFVAAHGNIHCANPSKRERKIVKIFFYFSFSSFFDHPQAHQDQIDLLNQQTEKLLPVADQPNRERIQRQNTDINLKWTNSINSIDNQIETLSHILQNWISLDRDISAIERSLNALKEKVKDIDFCQKSQTQLEEVKNKILVSRRILSMTN